MPMLFISYRRGDALLPEVLEALRASKYRLWLDTDSIVTGEMWRRSIAIGIVKSAAVVVLVSPGACSSQEVQKELALARAHGRPIFPVITYAVTAEDLAQLDLTPIQYVDITDPDIRAVAFGRLIDDLTRHGIRVTRHDWQAADKASSLQRQHYLRKLWHRIGFVNLSRISQSAQDISLADVYVPLPTELSFSIQVNDFRITDWDLTTQLPVEQPSTPVTVSDGAAILGPRVEMAPLEAVIDQLQQYIDAGIDGIYSTPQERPLLLAPPWYDGQKPSFWPLYAEDAAAAVDRLVILGPPGSGKSTFARHLALCLLGAQLDPPLKTANLSSLGHWPHGALTPIYIEMRQFVAWHGFPALGSDVSHEHFWQYVVEDLLGDDLKPFASELHDDLREGRAVIILDGLDEVPVPAGEHALTLRRKQLQELGRILSMVYERNRIVFTSRDFNYQGWELDGYTSLRLASLSAKHMERLAANLFARHDRHAASAQARTAAFIHALGEVPLSLKDRPLFLTLLATIFVRNSTDTLPTNNGDLYYESIMLLLDRWVQPRLSEPSLADQLGCTLDQLYTRLEIIAYTTQLAATAQKRPSADIDLSMLLVEFFRLGAGAKLYDIIAFLTQQSGVLVSPAPDIYRFAHRSFQEYLAASYMARQSDFALVRQGIEQRPEIWRESCLLVADVLRRAGRSTEIWDLLDTLLDVNLPLVLQEGDARVWSVWLAARLAHGLSVRRTNVSRRNQPVFTSLRRWMKLALATLGGLPPQERVDVGVILGEFGDDRRGVGVRTSLPDIDWCTIPAGEVTVGMTEERIARLHGESWAEGWTYTRETPAGKVRLPEFQISRYLITQAQFETFVAARDGYDNPQWWTSAGRAWRKANEITGPGAADWGKRANYPRTNTSWYEAVAFCAWLSARLHRKVRLPSEAEWERAARGQEGRLFPWGDVFDPTRANVEATGIGSVCPVGCFPVSEGPWGAKTPVDMCGNVWEWCTTICETTRGEVIPYPYRLNDGRDNLECGDEYLRVVRGGSYLNTAFVVRSTFRGRDKPTARYGRQGFRIVAEASTRKPRWPLRRR